MSDELNNLMRLEDALYVSDGMFREGIWIPLTKVYNQAINSLSHYSLFDNASLLIENSLQGMESFFAVLFSIKPIFLL